MWSVSTPTYFPVCNRNRTWAAIDFAVIAQFEPRRAASKAARYAVNGPPPNPSLHQYQPVARRVRVSPGCRRRR